MKTILAATDFSAPAGAALRFAAAMAKDYNAGLRLLHVVQPPIASAEGYVVIPDMDALKLSSQKKLERFAKQLKEKYGRKLPVVCETRVGFTADEIEICAHKTRCDLVIMGMRGSTRTSDRLLGSEATSFMKHGSFPLLTVHKNQKYKKIRNIVLAADFREPPGAATLRTVKTIASRYAAHVTVLHVFNSEDEKPTVEEAGAGLALKKSLRGVKHSFEGVIDADTAGAINTFVRANKADLLVLLKHSHNLLERIFTSSTGKKMAFASFAPLLTLKVS